MAEIAKQLERARRSLEKNKLRDAVEEYQAIFDEAPRIKKPSWLWAISTSA